MIDVSVKTNVQYAVTTTLNLAWQCQAQIAEPLSYTHLVIGRIAGELSIFP